MLYSKLACDDCNAPGLIRHGLLGVENIRMHALTLTPTRHFARRPYEDRCPLSEAP